MLMQTYMRLSSASPSGHQPMLACLVWGDESRIYQFQKWLPLSLVEAQYLEGCAAGLTWCSLAIWSSNRASGCLAAENRSALQGQPVTNYFNIDKLIYIYGIRLYISKYKPISTYSYSKFSSGNISSRAFFPAWRCLPCYHGPSCIPSPGSFFMLQFITFGSCRVRHGLDILEPTFRSPGP